MATKEDISLTYDFLDDLFRLRFGPHPDMTAGMYHGDYSKSLEQAQQEKHDFILDAVRCASGSRILDVGCGDGPMLKAIAERGGHGIGLTLSAKQADNCRRGGYEAYCMDWKEITPDTFGPFDAIMAVGSIEHYCSMEEYRAGRQDEIYDAFFHLSSSLLPSGGRLYAEAFVFGKNAPDLQHVSLAARKGSDEYILAVTFAFYPGSCPPFGGEQIQRAAAPYFRLICQGNGRLDFIETMNQWDRTWTFDRASLKDPMLALRRLWAISKVIPRLLLDADMRQRLEYVWRGYDTEGWKRELLDYPRMVFEKR